MNVSHDLRTPLTALSGYVELLKGEHLSPAGQRYLAQIEDRAQAMKAMTEEPRSPCRRTRWCGSWTGPPSPGC